MNTIILWAQSPIGVAAVTSVGAALLILSVYAVGEGRKIPPEAPTHLAHWLMMVKALRLALSGLCLMGLGAGLFWETAALTVPAIVIGLEELYETTMVITVLKRAQASAEAGGPAVSMRTLMTARPGRW